MQWRVRDVLKVQFEYARILALANSECRAPGEPFVARCQHLAVHLVAPRTSTLVNRRQPFLVLNAPLLE